VNPFLYYNYRWGTLVTAAAGPLTNLSLAFVFATLFKISLLVGGEVTVTGQFLFLCLILNVVLGVFNLLPVPPLDGSHILGAILPGALGEAYEKLRMLGWVVILVLVTIPQTCRLLFQAVGFGAGLFLQIMGVDLQGIVEALGRWPTPSDLLRAWT
jgi:Zn-dependent protease